MGQTLSHGVYLPAEGERNCYSGLASNWNLLDTAIGDTAGKASATHTHGNITNDGKVGTTANLPLITGTGGAIQAGSFGNAANTFCEGNDSRLSDARTPVAHTHGKADITDLLNSNFIPSANNSYDLGSSSYQWNNLYAKNYYYNGTAWGLDKANVWTNTNTFQQNITYERTNLSHNAVNPCYILKDTGLEKGSIPPAAHAAYPGLWHDKNSAILGYMRFVAYDTGKQTAEIRVSNLIKNGALDPTGSAVACTVHLVLQPSGEKSLVPEQNNDIDLGTSTNKWKSLNGINPGALSFPDYTLAKMDLIDFSQWSVAGQPNQYTPISDGWLFVNIKDTASNSIFIYAHGLYNTDPTKATDYSVSCFGNGSQGANGRISVMIPVRAGIAYRVFIRAASVSEIWSAKFYPALGNV